MRVPFPATAIEGEIKIEGFEPIVGEVMPQVLQPLQVRVVVGQQSAGALAFAMVLENDSDEDIQVRNPVTVPRK